MKMLHKHNLSNNTEHLRDKNHSDYSKMRQERIDGEYRKKMNKQNDLKQKQVYYSL